MTDTATEFQDAIRAIEGYFGDEFRQALGLTKDQAFDEVNRWLRDEQYNDDAFPAIDPWVFGRAFDHFLEWVNEQPQWQVTYDDPAYPHWGNSACDMFDNEQEAQKHAEAMYDEGHRNVTLTEFHDTAAVNDWLFIDGEWR